MVDEGSGKTVSVIHRTVPNKENAGMTDAGTAWNKFVNDWVKNKGKPLRVRTDPEGCYRARELHDKAEQHGIVWDVSPAEAHWRQARVEVTWQLIQIAANKMAMLDPECAADELF